MPDGEAGLSEADRTYVAQARTGAERLGVRDAGPDPSRDALADLESILPFDADPPSSSAGTAAGMVKSAVKRLVRWYLAYLANQVTALGEATVRLGSHLADRVDDLDETARRQSARIDELDRRLKRLETSSGAPDDQR